MEARQCAEFTDGAELAALVEKGAAGPCTGEARGGREARWRGRKTGLLCSGAEEILAGGARRCDEEGGAVESAVAEAARQSIVTPQVFSSLIALHLHKHKHASCILFYVMQQL
jgi:hypothetical protein